MTTKLIDGTAFADRLFSDAITDDQRRQANMIRSVIDEMREAVVRCGECKYFMSYYHGDDKFSNRCLWTLATDVKRDDYCSSGVRKNA